MALLSAADGRRSACERQKCREHSVSPPWRPHLPALHVCAHCRFRSLHSLAVFRVSGSASTESGRVRRPYRPDQCSPDDYLVANSEIFALAVPATCVWSEPCLCTWGDGTTSHRPVLAAAGATVRACRHLCVLSASCLRVSEGRGTGSAAYICCEAFLGIVRPPGSWRLRSLLEMRRVELRAMMYLVEARPTT